VPVRAPRPTSALPPRTGTPSAQPVFPARSLAAQFNALGWPKKIAWIRFHGSLDEEDEEPVMELTFHEAGDHDNAAAVLQLDVDGLKALNANRDAAPKDFA
jgi:hypothetical protein